MVIDGISAGDALLPSFRRLFNVLYRKTLEFM